MSTSKWTPIGPAPIETKGGLNQISGRIQAAAPDPTDPAKIYLAADNGGIWKNSNPPNWTPLTDYQRSPNFNGYHPLVVHPANHKLVLGLVSGPGAGILKSVDGGQTWQLLANSQFEGQALGALAVHPTNTDLMYLSAAWFGAWQSSDGGVSWQRLNSLPGGSVSDLIMAKYDSSMLFAGLVGNAGAQQGQNGVYKSPDSGATWIPLGGLPAGAALGGNNASGAVRLESGKGAGIVYASLLTLATTPPLKVTAVQRFRSGDSGSTWKALAASGGSLENRSWHLLLAVDPGDGDHVFANDAYSLWESWDAGKSWSQADAGIGYLSFINHFDFVNLTFDANRKAVITADQGVLRYDPAAKSWTSLMGDLEVSEFYTIGLDPKTAGVAYAVGQDIFCEKYTGQTEWNVMEGAIGETGKIIVDPKNSSQLFAFNPGDTSNFVRQSADAGSTWNTIFPAALLSASFLNIYNQTGGYGFAYASQKAFALDPSNPARLLAVADRVFQTTNAGSASPTWTPISGVLSKDPNNPFVIAIAIAPSDGDTVYASSQDGHLWVTYNDGATWSECDSGIAGAVIDLRVDPADSNHVFAITGGGVWHLQSSGLPWVKITGSIPGNLGLRSLFVVWEPAVPALFVGTDRGIYRSFDLGGNWSKWVQGLPNTSVNDLQGEIIGGELLLAAGTYGRGAWEILVRPWGSVATAIANSGNFGNVCVGSFADELLTIDNNGWGPLLITNIASSDSADFEPPSVVSYPLLINAGESIEVVLRFQPTGPGPKSATITIFSNDPGGPHKIQVAGNAPTPRLSLMMANSGDFGKTCAGSFSDEPLILNNSGQCMLLVTGITSSSAEFVVPQALTYPLSIAPGNFLPAPIRFAPASIGPKSATITVLSNDPAGPKTIAVSGQAPSGQLAVTGSTNFGGVKACCCADRALSICNVGACDLHVKSVAFRRKSPHWKLLNNPFPATLHAGSCLCLVLRYKATEKCPRPCELVIESDDPVTPVRTLDVLAYTIWDDCGCKEHCEECRQGRCDEHGKGCSQGYPCCCEDDEDENET
ncbi:MAG TPA: choice-of-anchor D domain-containing protein [Candidatus Binatia bacterium]|nr:choice-of-anchor D domain-containing protein [Candidatus Binatia bacterium]